jgi:hypothetical protein
MPIDPETIIRMLEAMRVEQREDHHAVLSRMNKLDDRLAALNANGCAQAWQHKAQGDSISRLHSDVADLKESRAEGRGRGAVVAVVVSAVVSVLVAVVVASIKKVGV